MGDLVHELTRATDRLITDLEVAQRNLATLLESVALSVGEELSTEPSAEAVDRAKRVLAVRARLQLWSIIDRNALEIMLRSDGASEPIENLVHLGEVVHSEARQALVFARSETEALRLLHAQLGLPADGFYSWAANVEVLGSAQLREGVVSIDEVEGE